MKKEESKENIDSEKETCSFIVDLVKQIKVVKKLDTQILCFVNTKDEVKKFYEFLSNSELKNDLKIAWIGGNMPNIEKRKTMDDFRQGGYDIMFATNLLARGVDIRTVGLVINIDCPRKAQGRELDHTTYLHRVARTGRYNDIGVAVTIFKAKNPDVQV